MISPPAKMLPVSATCYSYANAVKPTTISRNAHRSYVRAMRVTLSSRVIVYLTPKNAGMNCWAKFEAYLPKGSNKIVLTPLLTQIRKTKLPGAALVAGPDVKLPRVRACGRIYSWPDHQWSFQIDRKIASLRAGKSKRLRKATNASGDCPKYKWIVSSAQDGRRPFKLAVKPEDRFQFEHLWNAAASEPGIQGEIFRKLVQKIRGEGAPTPKHRKVAVRVPQDVKVAEYSNRTFHEDSSLSSSESEPNFTAKRKLGKSLHIPTPPLSVVSVVS